ncbi:hypothetical protein C4K04_2724 [Pseudomonas chlororaphis]|uniref:Uncharacterized protein n=2 Tax=Pseudomonas chlororaphis TaxID=587753 RepID=A0A3G7TQ84_9PSED|nr:hypothetical protein C4K04_2724 [Pseudomonas chlororaphis]
MVGYWMTPDDETNVSGGGRRGGLKEHYDDVSTRPGPSPAPHPTPPLIDDLNTRIAALHQTSHYLLNSGVLSTDGLSNQDVKNFFEEQMQRWSNVPEYEDLIKPYQLWIGAMLKGGPNKFIPMLISWVPATGRISIGAKQSISATTTNLSTGFSGAVCSGVEVGYSPAQRDGINGSVDQTYNLNLGYVGFTYIPDKSISVRFEVCIPPSSSIGVSTGVSVSRGFSQTLSKPKQMPWPTPTPGNLQDEKLR